MSYFSSTNLEEKTSIDLKYFLKFDSLSLVMKVTFKTSKWWSDLHSISHLSLKVFTNISHFNIRRSGTC